MGVALNKVTHLLEIFIDELVIYLGLSAKKRFEFGPRPRQCQLGITLMLL